MGTKAALTRVRVMANPLIRMASAFPVVKMTAGISYTLIMRRKNVCASLIVLNSLLSLMMITIVETNDLWLHIG